MFQNIWQSPSSRGIEMDRLLEILKRGFRYQETTIEAGTTFEKSSRNLITNPFIHDGTPPPLMFAFFVSPTKKYT